MNRLRREGALLPGRRMTWAWRRDGEQTATIGLTAISEGIELAYTATTGSGEATDVHYLVRITSTACNFGGRRPWFVCPGAGCSRRVGKLYLVRRYFLCRHCHGLAYQSQREHRLDRLSCRAARIRTRLGGSASISAPFPPKPKGMHWRTYERLRTEAEDAERAWENGIELWMNDAGRG